MDLQVTLFDKNKKYKPMSTIIKGLDSMDYYTQHKGEVLKRAIENICHQRKTDYSTLKRNGYTQFKVREYDIEKIKQQQLIKRIKAIQAKREQAKEGVDVNE